MMRCIELIAHLHKKLITYTFISLEETKELSHLTMSSLTREVYFFPAEAPLLKVSNRIDFVI